MADTHKADKKRESSGSAGAGRAADRHDDRRGAVAAQGRSAAPKKSAASKDTASEAPRGSYTTDAESERASQRRYSRIVLRELVKTDFKMRYQGSVLGMAWSVLKPLMLFVVMYLVFVRFLRFTDGTPHYAMSLLLGTVLWSFFSEASNMGLTSIVGHGDLLRKVHFPNYIIVVAATLNSFISLAINLVVVLIFSIINGVHFTWRILLAPLGIAELYLFTLGVAFMLATFDVYFRDIQHIWEVFLQALYFSIPIIYPISMVQNVSPVFAKIILLNPIAQSIQDVRWCIIAPESTVTVWNYINSPSIKLVPFLIVALVLVLGIGIFNRNSRKFAEIL